jgi:gamma-butyrobetaine dioxygenase
MQSPGDSALTTVVDEIFALFARFGSAGYGENVSLESHMLQSAALAEALGAPASVVAAALLHDIGYFLCPDSETSIAEGRDVAHEAVGAAWLSRAFGPEITAPIALHVDAKRYLCATEPGYHATLSEASRMSLILQGGVMDDAEVARFAANPAHAAALLLRRCDDRGKEFGTNVPPLGHYRSLLTGLLV